MALSEVDSFFLKFKNLLHSGTNANLTIRSEAGKAFVTLAVEVEHLGISNLLPRSRNGPSRQRRRQRRAEVRETASREAAEEANDPQVDSTHVGAVIVPTRSQENDENVANINTIKSAEEAKDQKNVQKAVLVEPSDEIVNEEISNEICATISVIPIRNINATNEYLEKAIIAKLEAKNVKVKDTSIQKSIQGTFIKCDVLIEPLSGKILEETNFEFENCRVVPFYGPVSQ